MYNKYIFGGISILSIGCGYYYYKYRFHNSEINYSNNEQIPEINDIESDNAELENIELTNEDQIEHYNEEINKINENLEKYKKDVEKMKVEYENSKQANNNNDSKEDIFDELQLENKKNLYLKKKKFLKKMTQEEKEKIKIFTEKINQLSLK